LSDASPTPPVGASRPGGAAMRVTGQVKHFRAVDAVRGIDLEVRPGEAFGFVVPDGAGKTARSGACST
jgi:lipooligosaccharide transport system ATP-binding protein